MKAAHILIVEDEPEIAAILKDYMANEGYRTTLIGHGEKVLPFLKETIPSLILLDLLLPGIDGKHLCREIRKFSDVPVIMITAKADEIDRIIGFELGTDDYICKPFSPREVVVRVNAVLRRAATSERVIHKILSSGSIQLDIDTRQATINGNTLDLTPNEFDILNVMIARPCTVFSRAKLIDQVQGYNFEGYERTIDFHIKNLRKKIALHLPDRKIIQSIYGVGYKLVPDI